MENLQDYIKPELLILVPVLYVIGSILKNTNSVSDKYIPAILGVVGVILSFMYVVATEGIALIGVFTAITQGVLVTGVAVYVNQLYKQSKNIE